MAFDGFTPGAPSRGIIWFAGGGGTSQAYKTVFGRDPDVALNHWPTAVMAHQRHHPRTAHFCADAFDLEFTADGTPVSITDQTHMTGNMVPRHMAAAHIAANVPGAGLQQEIAA